MGTRRGVRGGQIRLDGALQSTIGFRARYSMNQFLNEYEDGPLTVTAKVQCIISFAYDV